LGRHVGKIAAEDRLRVRAEIDLEVLDNKAIEHAEATGERFGF
jgi:hypothetical protein